MRTTLFFLGFLLFFSVDLHAQEEIRITTFYPSPNGSYNQLQAQRLGVGDVDNNGTFNAADIPTTDGDVWIKGKVGIGTTSPGTTLTLGKNGAISMGTSIGSNDGALYLTSAGSVNSAYGAGISMSGIDHASTPGEMRIVAGNSAGAIKLVTAGADRLTILNDGNAGIGTASPTQGKLVVQGVGATPLVLGRSNGGDELWGFNIDNAAGQARTGYFYKVSGTNNLAYAFSPDAGITWNMVIQANGNVGIGTTTPGAYKLYVNGNQYVAGSLGANGLMNAVNQPVCANAAGNLILCPSSRRFKTDIQDLDVDTAKVLELRPVNFKWKETGTRDVGLIAEEVNDTIKELVSYNKDGQVHGVQYDKIGVYLLKVVKQQQQQIDKLAAEIEALKKAKQ